MSCTRANPNGGMVYRLTARSRALRERAFWISSRFLPVDQPPLAIEALFEVEALEEEADALDALVEHYQVSDSSISLAA